MVGCRVLCDSYRLGDVASGYFGRHFNISTVCPRWPGSFACELSEGGDVAQFCKRLKRERPAPEFAIHLRLGDVLDWPLYQKRRPYNFPLEFFARVALPSSNVTLFGNPYYRDVFGAAHSLHFRTQVAAILRRRNASVSVPRRQGSASEQADADFADLVFARSAILAKGGYASLVSRCRRERSLRNGGT